MTCGCISKDLSCRPSIGHNLNMHIIIARCREPLDWLKNNEYSSVTIFEKCSKHASNHQKKYFNNISSSFNNTIIDNVGREAHAYLHYIVETYEQIQDNDLYIFVQGDAQSEIQFSPLTIRNISQTLKLLSHKTLFAQLSGLFTRIEKNSIHHANLPWIENTEEIHVLRGQFVVRGKAILQTNISSWKNYLKYSELHPAQLNYNDFNGCAADCQFEGIWNILFHCRVTKKCIPQSFKWGRHTFTSGILECYENG